MKDGVVVLEPGDVRARKIGKAIASKAANEILSLVREKDEQTLTEISDAMCVPMTTAKYHVENLLDAGMLEVARTKWSEKGRQIKVYSVSDQVVIVNTGTVDLRALLLRYSSLFGILLLVTLLIAGLAPLMASSPLGLQKTSSSDFDAGAAVEDTNTMRAPVAPEAYGASLIEEPHSLFSTGAVAFFAGGCLVLLCIILYDIIRDIRLRKKEENPPHIEGQS